MFSRVGASAFPRAEIPAAKVIADGIAIRVNNLGKCYQVYDAPRDRLKQFVAPRLQRLTGQIPKRYFREFWALKDVSIEVKKSETIGIVGRNGSGKSTLLQLICGTLTPSSGSVESSGRMAALLDLGAGFNPEFTGRDNVYMNGAVLGLTRDDIRRRFDEIAAFADIGEFIEQPVKTYSGGMFVRLAFAINIVSEPEIMIVDEALAVGDMKFRARCITALTRMQKRGATVLLVSHDIDVLKSLCSRGIHLERGTVRSIGRAPEVAEAYLRMMREEISAESRRFARAPAGGDPTMSNAADGPGGDAVLKRSEAFDRGAAGFRYGTGGTRITYVELVDMHDRQIQSVEFNQQVRIRIHVESSSEQRISVSFNIRDERKLSVTGCGFTQVDREFLATAVGGRYLVEYTLRLPLQEGSYSVQTLVSSPVVRGETAEFIDVIEDAVVFQVGRWPNARVWSKVHLFPSLRLTTIDGRGQP